MVRSDLLLSLASAALDGDQQHARSALRVIAAEEAQKRHGRVAERIEGLLDASPVRNFRDAPQPQPTQSVTRSSGGGVREVDPVRGFDQLALSTSTLEVVSAVVEEQSFRRELRASGLEPRSRILLTGEPGTGKTSLAEAIAYELSIPFYVLQYEAIIASFLGDTSSRLSMVFERAAESRCVLFFDEFETLAKERGDEHDTGEVKRIVSTLLLQIDALPSHVVVVGATNHPELLDRAAWRRFQVHIEMPLPSKAQVRSWTQTLCDRLSIEQTAQILHDIEAFVDPSYATIEEHLVGVKRRQVIRAVKERLSS